MNIDRSYTKRLVKRTIFLLLGIILLLTISLVVAWHVLRSDHPYVIERIQETAFDKWNAKLQLESYELEFTKPFPLIKLQIKGFVFGDANQLDYPFLKINQAASQFNPWNLISGDFNAHPLELDSVWIHMHEDSLQNSNLDFNQNHNDKAKRNSIDLDIDELPFITVNYLDFNRQNKFRNQQQWFKLSQMSIIPRRQDSGEWSANVKCDSHFETLLFKPEDGSYLDNTHGKLNLNIDIANRGKSILFDNSSLIVDEEEYLLAGHFVFDEVNKLKLEINHEGVLLSNTLPLLSENIRYILRDIKIDQAIRSSFTLNKDLIQDRLGSVRVDFATSSTSIQYQGVDITDAILVGHYTNDIAGNGFGDPSTAEVFIDTLAGDLLQILPIKMNAIITDLKDNPKVAAQATIDINMPRLNPLLSANDKITFSDGIVHVDLDYQCNLQSVLSSPFSEQYIQMSGNADFTNVSLETNSSIAPSPSLTGSMSFDENETRFEELILDWMGSQVTLQGSLANLPEFLFYNDQALQSRINLHFDQLDLNRFTDANKSKSSDQKKQLTVESVESITRQVASNINGEIDLRIDKLVYDSIYLTDLRTHLSMYTPRLAEYIDSSLINIQGLTANFMGHTPMEFNLRYTRDSTTNILLGLDMVNAARSANLFLPKTTKIANGDLTIHLDAKVSLRKLLQSKNLIKDVALDGTLLFDKLDLAMPRVELPIKEISGKLIFDKEHVDIEDTEFQYSGSPFRINGTIKDYAAAFSANESYRKAKVDISLKGDFLNLRTAEPISADIKRDEVATLAEIFRSLDTVFQYATGHVDLYLDSVITNDHVFQPFLLNANLISDSRNTNQHRLRVDSFNLGLGEKNYIKGNLTVDNPDDPVLEADILAHMDFKRVGDFLSSKYIEFEEGYFDLDLNYEASLYDTISAENYLLGAAIDGNVKVVDGKLFYNYRDFSFDDINGVLKFDERALYIPNLDLKVNDNIIFANGSCTEFFPFFIQPDQKVSILLDLKSPYFDFGNFTAPQGLGKDTLVDTQSNLEQDTLQLSKLGTDGSSQNTISQTHGFIDQLLDKGSMKMNTSIEKLVYRNFFAEDIEGNMTMQSDTVQLHDMSMEVAEGGLKVSGLISETALHRPKLEIDVKLAGNNISEIFRQLDDFGQEAISYKHLEGIASADLTFKAQADANYTILKKSLFGDLSFQITGGQFEDVPVLSELKGFIFKNRRLDDIALDTLSVLAHMRGSKMYIKKFNIHSSPFDFDVEGVYDLLNKDSTSILLSLPMGNLNRRYVNPKDLESKKYIRKGPLIHIESRFKKDRYRFFWKPIVLRKRTRYKIPEKASSKIDVIK